MPKVNENLRRQWTNQLAQMKEEREVDQRGRARSPEDVKIQDFDIAVHEHLLALPLGATFDMSTVWAACEQRNQPMTGIAVGSRVEAVTASGATVLMRATSPPVRGRDFPVVWLCTEEEWAATPHQHLREPWGVPWPLRHLRQIEPNANNIAPVGCPSQQIHGTGAPGTSRTHPRSCPFDGG